MTSSNSDEKWILQGIKRHSDPEMATSNRGDKQQQEMARICGDEKSGRKRQRKMATSCHQVITEEELKRRNAVKEQVTKTMQCRKIDDDLRRRNGTEDLAFEI